MPPWLRTIVSRVQNALSPLDRTILNVYAITLYSTFTLQYHSDLMMYYLVVTR